LLVDIITRVNKQGLGITHILRVAVYNLCKRTTLPLHYLYLLLSTGIMSTAKAYIRRGFRPLSFSLIAGNIRLFAEKKILKKSEFYALNKNVFYKLNNQHKKSKNCGEQLLLMVIHYCHCL